LHCTSVNGLQRAFKTYCLSETSFMHIRSVFLSQNHSYEVAFSATKFIFTAFLWLELAAFYRFKLQSVICLLSPGCLNEQKHHAVLLCSFCVTKFDEVRDVHFLTFRYELIAQEVVVISCCRRTRAQSALMHTRVVNVTHHDIEVGIISMDLLCSHALPPHLIKKMNDGNFVSSPYRMDHGPDSISL
jgi:hypothetical protein